MADVEVKKSKIHGIGVFAAREFQKDEIILKIDDSRIVGETHPLRPKKSEFEFHCDYLADGRVVLMPSPKRYINSCCDPRS